MSSIPVIDPKDSLVILYSTYFSKGLASTLRSTKDSPIDKNADRQLNSFTLIFKQLGEFYKSVNEPAFEDLKQRIQGLGKAFENLPPFMFAMTGAMFAIDPKSAEPILEKLPSTPFLEKGRQLLNDLETLDAALAKGKKSSKEEIVKATDGLAKTAFSFH